MKRRTRQYRSIAVSSSRWTAYAVAGLAAASAAEAAIHYTDPEDVKLRRNNRAIFPLDDLGDSLFFQHLKHTNFEFSFPGFSLLAPGASVRGSRRGGTFSFLSNLKPGSYVSQGTFRSGGFGELAVYSGGNFDEPGIGIIGFVFDHGSGKQYGWARVEMAGREHKNNFRVLDYAYADPGEPIQAGQTSDEPVTGMGSLGLLAAGAVGLRAWRTSRSGSAIADAP